MILCDNIVFELQDVGGVSKYWAETIKRLDHSDLDMSFLEGPGVSSNIFRQQITLGSPIVPENGSAMLRRFRGPNMASKIFHSSYYRISRKAQFNVVTIHDFMNEMFPSTYRDPILARLKKRACSHADRIVVVSERTKQDLLRNYPNVDPGIVNVLYNGVGVEFFPDPVTTPIEAKGLHIKPQGYFLYVGTRGHCKNFPYVLSFLAEAHKQGMNAPLVIVGGGALSEKEYAEADRLGLPKDVFLHCSGVDNIVLRRLYSNTIALLIPSLYEGFGLPAAEAARCGALVLASRSSALKEITGSSDYSFDLKSSGEAARILSLGLQTSGALAERKRVQDRSKMFNWDTSTTNLMGIYDELLHT